MGLLQLPLLLVLAQSIASPFVSALSVPRGLQARDSATSFCHLPAGYEWCNDENNRSCWMRNNATGKVYSIDTDYEDEFPPGIERTYWLEIGEADVSPDGVLKKAAQVINGTYPGPLIEACWGDTLTINVKNTLPTNGTTIHWHGLRMFQQNEMDGVNGVTQCPISEGDSFQYKFQLRQYGHTWYHSHYSSQYTDGVAAPLLIHGPNTDEWDEQWSPIIIADWYHENAYEAFADALGPRLPPDIDALVVNGTGKNYNTSTGNYYENTFVPGNKHLIRVINGGTDFHFHFSIDNHVLKVVSADMVPIVPFYTNSLSVGIGQRYSVIVEANQTISENGAYWMRAEYNSTLELGCTFNHLNFPDLTLAEDPQRVRQRVGIVRYGTNSTGEPTTLRWTDPVGCTDPLFEPHVKWNVTAPQNDIVPNTYFTGLGEFAHGFQRWEVADKPLWLNFSDPTLKNLDNTTWNPEYAVEPYDYRNPEGFVFLIINSGGHDFANGTHPIHLHGHDFAIISAGPGNIDPANPPPFTFGNLPRRDVAMLPDNGHLVMAFKSDNPGAWLLHCHIAWHAGSGLGLQVLENQSIIKSTIGSLEPMQQGCKKWTNWLDEHPDRFNYGWQDDSGI